jgi:hypothetical protein
MAKAERLAPHLERIRSLSWASFSFTLPPLWEVTGYELGERGQRLQFHRRAVQRGELSWREAKGTPDQPRIMAEVHRRWLERESPAELAGFAALACERVGEFVLGRHRQGAPAHATLWQPEERRLLQWLFPSWSDELQESELRPLLESYRPNRVEPRRWELFGLRLRLPEQFGFEELRPQPTNVALVFETRKNLRITGRRIGMDREVLAHGDLAALHYRLLSRESCRVRRQQPSEFLGRPAVRSEFERRGESRMETLTGKWWPGEGWIWRDDAEGRIYAIEQLGPPKQPRIGLSDAVS